MKASLLVRPMMTLVGICPVNNVSKLAMLAPVPRMMCLVTTWASGYLASEAVRTFSMAQLFVGSDLDLAYIQDGVLDVYKGFWLATKVHEVERWLTKWQHQPDIHVVGHQSLLQQHARVQPALEVKELAAGDRCQANHQADVFLSIILSLFVHVPAF